MSDGTKGLKDLIGNGPTREEAVQDWIRQAEEARYEAGRVSSISSGQIAAFLLIGGELKLLRVTSEDSASPVTVQVADDNAIMEAGKAAGIPTHTRRN